MPTTGKALGEWVAGEEVVQSAIVVPGSDQTYPPGSRPGHRPIAERDTQNLFGIGQAWNIEGVRPAAEQARRSTPTNLNEMHGDDHDGAPCRGYRLLTGMGRESRAIIVVVADDNPDFVITTFPNDDARRLRQQGQRDLDYAFTRGWR